MGHGTKRRRRAALAVFFALAAPAGLPGGDAPRADLDKIAVIVNKVSPLTWVRINDLADIYKGRKAQWAAGAQIYVINQDKKSSARAAFYWAVLKASPEQVFYLPDGTEFRTVEAPTDKGVKRFVSSIPYAIGYIDKRFLDDTVKRLPVIEEVRAP